MRLACRKGSLTEQCTTLAATGLTLANYKARGDQIKFSNRRALSRVQLVKHLSQDFVREVAEIVGVLADPGGRLEETAAVLGANFASSQREQLRRCEQNASL